MHPDKLKIVVIGDSAVGKTSLRRRYMGEGFRGSYTATLGSEFSVKKIRETTITLFDLAGDPASKFLRSGYYAGTDGFIVVFDITNRKSFENLEGWFDEIRSNLGNGLKVFILGNKEDLRDMGNDRVEEDEAYEYANRKAKEFDASISFLTTSALTGYNVEVAFNKLIAEITMTEN
ncbi:MAG: Rab family GTPase [Candidatus Kariarchaeaceae archaeon]|jgi:small GTP-binding protein